MSDFAPLGSFSTLDELGPTRTTWQPAAFRAVRVAPRQPLPQPVREGQTAAEPV